MEMWISKDLFFLYYSPDFKLSERLKRIFIIIMTIAHSSFPWSQLDIYNFYEEIQ